LAEHLHLLFYDPDHLIQKRVLLGEEVFAKEGGQQVQKHFAKALYAVRR